MSSTTPGIAPSAQANGTRHRNGPNHGDGHKAEGVQSAVSSAIPTLGDGGGAQKSVDEHFQVDAIRGSLTTSFAILTSPGRGGFGPQLALSYDSSSGNGPFGLGWNLGLSAISRKTATQIPQYLDDDVFVLSGADDLVPVDGSKVVTLKHGDKSKVYTVQTFRPRTDDLSKRVERWTRQDDAEDIHWRVISRLNHCSIYGWSDASRIFNSEGQTKRIFSWLLCRSYDIRGNAIQYHYKAEDGFGLPQMNGSEERQRPCLTQKYLSRISYSNLSPARDMKTWDIVLPDTSINDWAFDIVLDYHLGDSASASTPWEARKDSFSRFNAGFEVRTSRLCRRICMVHNFPNESPGGNGIVVSATEIAYNESAKGSFITSLTRCGYSSHPGSGELIVHREPPYKFDYSSAPPPEAVQPHVMPGVMQTNASLGGGRWLDLEGEGAPGYLATGEDGRWTFQRNMNAACVPGVTFAAPLVLPTLPSEAQDSLRTSTFVDLDQNGSLDVVYFDDKGRAEGFVERVVDRSKGYNDPTWCAFESFDKVPNMPFQDTAPASEGLPTVQMLDLTGNGLEDLLIINKETDEVVWYECLAKVGYGPAIRRPAFFGTYTPSSISALSPSAGDLSLPSSRSSVSDERSSSYGLNNTSNSPWIVSGRPDMVLFAADMTGDGLADLVLVSNGSIVYWPNMGYGRFGRRITMTNAPLFDKPDQFTASRLVLADVDGTGTADVLYLPARGGVDIFYNCLGNSWQDVTRIESLPAIDDISSISAIDILGDGTSCLVWTGPDSANTDQSRVWYLPLMNGTKPHLMTKFSNGMGLETTAQYRPSTFFRQRDLLASRPWRNSMPSAMHCVSDVLTRDCITTVETHTSYVYHDGFYDYADSAFGGFGMVEMTKAKRVPLHGRLVEMSRSFTKTWFHTGNVFVGRELFHPMCPPHLDAERKYGDVAVSNDNPRNVYRALRGRALRQEIYDAMTQQNTHPLIVEESTFNLRLLELGAVEVFAVFPAESVRTEYDAGGQEEPRTSHSITVEVDDYANVTKSLSVNYGKAKSCLPSPTDRAKQEETVILATGSSFTHGFSEMPGTYAAPRQFEKAIWRVFGVETPQYSNGGDRAVLFSPRELQGVFDSTQVPVLDADESATAMRNTPTSFSPHKVLISCTRETFRNDRLDDVLDLGAVDLYSVTDRTYQLCLTPAITKSTYFGQTIEPSFAFVEAGYVDLDGDGNWWIPSECRRYHASGSSTESQGDITELQAARASFWMPTVTIDAFNNESSIDLDRYSLLPTAATDALKNKTSTKWDYLHLQPVLITDVNGNRKASLLSSLGEVAATATMGKPDELVGDSLDGLEDSRDLSQALMDDFYHNPTQALALTLMDSASQRVIRNRFAHQSDSTSGSVTPTWQATLTRVRHVHSESEHGDLGDELPDEDNGRVIIAFTFFDGQQRPLQTSLQLRDNAWKVEVSILDMDGEEIISYRSSIQSSHHFIHPSTPAVHPLGDVSFLNAQGHLVGRLHADHTWTKTILSPWTEFIHDANDVALVEDPSQDADVGHFFKALGDRDLYQPTWFWSKQQEAKALGEGSAVSAVTKQVTRSANTPRTLHKDALGRIIIVVDENPAEDGASTESLRTTYGVYGTAAACAVHDAMGRLTEVNKVDMIGRTIDRVGADYGRRATLLDVQGNAIRTWSSGGISTRKTYDALRRLKGRWVAEREGDMLVKEKLVEKLAYGDEMDHDWAKKRNLMGVLYEHLDQAGRARICRVDFKGNVTHSSRQLAVEFRKTIDWVEATTVQLEDEVFKHEARFDALNRMTLQRDASGCTTKQVYDASGQVSEVHLKGRHGQWARLSRTEYDAHGHETFVEHGSLASNDGVATTTTSMEYDPLSLAITRKKIVATSNKAGRKSTKVLLDETYHRDCLQRIVHQTDDSQLDIWYANNRVRPNKTFAYDTLGRLVQATGGAHVRAGHAGAGINVQDSGKDSQPQPGPAALYEYTETYTYNAAGNLLSLKHEPTSNSKLAGVVAWTRKYFYEEESCLSGASSSVLSHAFPSVNFGPFPVSSSAKPFPVYNNRLTRTQIGRVSELVHYDASTPGGIHGCPSSLSRWSSMTWNYDGLLRSSAALKVPSPSKGKPGTAPARTWYVYDGSGERRIRKVTERKSNGDKLKETIYLDGVDIFRRFSCQQPTSPSSSMSVIPVKSERVTVYGKASHAVIELWADKDGTERNLVRHQVHHGLELDPDGNVISHEEYSPFGRTVFSIRSRKDITAPRRYRFAGYQRDLETGLYYCNARYYAPWLGRWVSSDPIFSADGLDTYAYCGNDPVNHHDQDGTMFVWSSQSVLATRSSRSPQQTNPPVQVTNPIRLGALQRTFGIGGNNNDGNNPDNSRADLLNNSTVNAQQPTVHRGAMADFYSRRKAEVCHYHRRWVERNADQETQHDWAGRNKQARKALVNGIANEAQEGRLSFSEAHAYRQYLQDNSEKPHTFYLTNEGVRHHVEECPLSEEHAHNLGILQNEGGENNRDQGGTDGHGGTDGDAAGVSRGIITGGNHGAARGTIKPGAGFKKQSESCWSKIQSFFRGKS
ncbi:virulence plasmid 65kDa B protein-domain-containing protein [Apiosordaria backusii]|uniref:Virulence plasmid 65kDa B protein-domain-containing protein n=1 Tax=Apiosordaria backusii TaxID=314023 RepID=A0AA40DMZ7_9PEZI|nr:virulence plasmid 65kDa B protein-domain-containing protein [Apiosordaria backusii]